MRSSLAALNSTGFWPAPLPQTSYVFNAAGKANASGDFASTYVGDETDTSPFTPPSKIEAISTAEYLRNMNVLVQWLGQGSR